jgi:hypothetical protein
VAFWNLDSLLQHPWKQWGETCLSIFLSMRSWVQGHSFIAGCTKLDTLKKFLPFWNLVCHFL